MRSDEGLPRWLIILFTVVMLAALIYAGVVALTDIGEAGCRPALSRDSLWYAPA
jgi:hypothetical protein